MAIRRGSEPRRHRYPSAIEGRRPHVYRILFLVDNERVLVYRVLHAGQNYIDEDDL